MNREKSLVHVSMVDMLCSGTMPTHNGGQTRRATHHFSLFNPLRGAQKRELTKRLWKEKEAAEGGGVGYSVLLQHRFKGTFRILLVFDNLNLGPL